MCSLKIKAWLNNSQFSIKTQECQPVNDGVCVTDFLNSYDITEQLRNPLMVPYGI